MADHYAGKRPPHGRCVPVGMPCRRIAQCLFENVASGPSLVQEAQSYRAYGEHRRINLGARSSFQTDTQEAGSVSVIWASAAGPSPGSRRIAADCAGIFTFSPCMNICSASSEGDCTR